MKKGKFRLFFIIGMLLLIFYYLLPIFVKENNFLLPKKKLKLGLDLQGGMQILLEVDLNSADIKESEKATIVNSAIEIIRNRIDQFGVEEPIVQKIGKNRISIQLPGVKDFDRAKDLIGKTALLEFKLLANNEIVKEAYEATDEYLLENINKFPGLKEIVKDTLSNSVAKIIEDSSKSIKSIINSIFISDGNSMFVQTKNLSLLKEVLADEGLNQAIPFGIEFVFGKREANSDVVQVYVLIKKSELTGKYLEDAQVRLNNNKLMTSGNAYVSLKFDKEGAEKFATITEENINRRLAIVLDNVVYIAPMINDKIRGGEAQITGNFSVEEASDIVIVLRAGNLPAPVNVIEERSVGPTLGKDSIDSGLISGLIGILAISIFMLLYYKLSGLIANIALAVNIAFVLAFLTMFKATLTLPGIAGIILTIGMAIDANVIIYERIKEGILENRTISSAVEFGFKRAIITILDANITTLITAFVLYKFGTGPIKGFAVTLSIGIIGSMFTSIILVKSIFDRISLKLQKNKLSI